jgi:anaerobic ribonucleoside-triphosphate reductase activating protein
MKIGGLQKFSLIDYPGKTAAVIFTQGCNMFCPYCHNPQLVYPDLYKQPVEEKDILTFLEKRRGLLDGAVITGGEPTIYEDLPDFILKIKRMGYLAKLDTNGTNPEMLRKLIGLNIIDFIAMDIKSPPEKYNLFFGGDFNKIKKSVNIISESGLPHLFRTTFDCEILDDSDISRIKNRVLPSAHITQECIK